MSNSIGTLYIVATPIGNLTDITERAQQVLKTVDLIACEDTRHSRHLLARFGINTPLFAYHDHNEITATQQLIDCLKTGQNVALISDAGTPLINDPGFILVRTARAQHLPVVPIPGANAIICALSAAGLPTDRFLFLGFPPRTTSQRHTWAMSFINEPGTLVCYESGKRIVATLTDIAHVFGHQRQVVIARELTKQFETFLHGSLDELAQLITSNPEQQLGELVLIIAGAAADVNQQTLQEQQRILRILIAELPVKQATALTAQITGGSRNALYREALSIQQS
ncbi:16S rRNA (cytidine(1402)-2'-O)-methyltransferase [Thiospirillum jenense]|uniref:16S rRNA (cytidine(1402)-2'-O)-methyltransferase n=1 Tax=Thiospirillum jenense TaxID=1653858 RepID=UPI0030B8152C